MVNFMFRSILMVRWAAAAIAAFLLQGVAFTRGDEMSAMKELEAKIKSLPHMEGLFRDISMQDYVATLLGGNGWEMLADSRYHSSVRNFVVPEETAIAIYRKYRDRLLDDEYFFRNLGGVAFNSILIIASNSSTDGLWRVMEDDLGRFIPCKTLPEGFLKIAYESRGAGEAMLLTGLVEKFGVPEVKKLYSRFKPAGDIRQLERLFHATCVLPPDPELIAFRLSTVGELPESLAQLQLTLAAECYVQMSEEIQKQVASLVVDPKIVAKLKEEATKIPSKNFK